jgi:Arc/MetJ-type ribon-helix-helix transcriptional regulator
VTVQTHVTTQISVRLPVGLVKELDALVAEGRVRSRASVIERALARELRRALAERDIEILERTKNEPDPDDLDALARWAGRQPLDLD